MRQASDYIVFPLDVPSVEAARPFIEQLSGRIGMFKVGLELFIQAGPDIIRLIQASGPTAIFLDLKLHDIPTTVKRAMRVVADLGVRFATVHCGEASAMLEAAVEGCQGRSTGVLGVTVLTSVGSEDIETAGLKNAYSENIGRLVMKRAKMAHQAGCAGIVCSGHEVRQVKQAFGSSFQAITPGIRPSWLTVGDDQKRVMTPARAIENGSDYLVIGRPIRDADDQLEAVTRITEEIQAVL